MTDHVCVLVADGSRARLFRVRETKTGRGAELEELQVLTSPERNLPGRDVFSNLKSGRPRTTRRGPTHGYDDHRLRHREEVERQFARRIATATATTLRKNRLDWLIVLAEPRLLGLLRRPIATALPENVRRTEMRDDLTWHSLPHIRKVLEQHGAIPPKTASVVSWRPRGQAPPLPPPHIVAPSAPPDRATSRPRRGKKKRSRRLQGSRT